MMRPPLDLFDMNPNEEGRSPAEPSLMVKLNLEEENFSLKLKPALEGSCNSLLSLVTRCVVNRWIRENLVWTQKT